MLKDGSQCRRTDDGFRRAVVDDVGGLGGGEMGVDRHVVQTCAAGRPHGHVEVLIVLHQDRNGIALTETGLTEQVRQPIRPCLELTESDGDSGGIHDDSGFVGAGLRMLADLHVGDSTTGGIDDFR